MSKISSNFNRFLHGAVFNEMKNIDFLRVSLGDRVAIVPIKKISSSGISYLKWWLKQLNLDYPRTRDGKTLSTSALDTKQTMQHIEWCIKVMGENGHTFSFIEDEWNRLVNQYKDR